MAITKIDHIIRGILFNEIFLWYIWYMLRIAEIKLNSYNWWYICKEKIVKSIEGLLW